VTFPELGHLLFWEDPDGFADAVASFLLAREQTPRLPASAIASAGQALWSRRPAGSVFSRHLR